jgi:hypothetical protein
MYPIRKSRIRYSLAYSRLNSLLIYYNEPMVLSMLGSVQRKFRTFLAEDTLANALGIPQNIVSKEEG